MFLVLIKGSAEENHPTKHAAAGLCPLHVYGYVVGVVHLMGKKMQSLEKLNGKTKGLKRLQSQTSQRKLSVLAVKSCQCPLQ